MVNIRLSMPPIIGMPLRGQVDFTSFSPPLASRTAYALGDQTSFLLHLFHTNFGMQASYWERLLARQRGRRRTACVCGTQYLRVEEERTKERWRIFGDKTKPAKERKKMGQCNACAPSLFDDEETQPSVGTVCCGFSASRPVREDLNEYSGMEC